MRLLIVGTLEGHITTAGKIAMSHGAKVAQVSSIDEALTALRTGKGADLVMIDIKTVSYTHLRAHENSLHIV